MYLCQVLVSTSVLGGNDPRFLSHKNTGCENPDKMEEKEGCFGDALSHKCKLKYHSDALSDDESQM